MLLLLKEGIALQTLQSLLWFFLAIFNLALHSFLAFILYYNFAFNICHQGLAEHIFIQRSQSIPAGPPRAGPSVGGLGKNTTVQGRLSG